MLDELKKAFRAKRHPGMSNGLSLPVLARQSVPFVTSRAGNAKPPLTIYWSVNSICNLACKMCDVGMRNKDSNFFKALCPDGSRKEIPIDKFREVIDEVAGFRPMISITSTEPLLYRPLCEAIEHTRRKGLDVAVTTNGYTLPAVAESLVEAGLTRLNVSIDGPPEVHDCIRGRKDCFARATEGVARFKEAARCRGVRAEVLCAFTTTNLNYDKLAAFVDAVSGVPFDRINFSYMTFLTPQMAALHNATWGSKYPATVNCFNEHTRLEDVDPAVLYSQIQEIKARKDQRISFLPEFSLEQLGDLYHHPTRFLSKTRCMVSWFIAEIIANGDVIPYTRCYPIVLGNIHQQRFLDIWNGETMRAWRRELRRHRRFPGCSRCDQCY